MGSLGPTNVFSDASLDYDAIVIGAGLSGLFSTYRMRELGLRTKCIEAGSDVGGTWYWNRYPGARFDCESYSYQFSFSKEILDGWTWAEHFSPQTETLQYIQFVAEQLKLRPLIQFDTRIKTARWNESSTSWELTDQLGQTYTSRLLITAMGFLSAPTLPNIPGVNDFKGQSCHTAAWPREGIDFAGKRVGIVGTGATGIQTIQELVKSCGHLTVFQRHPSWAAPLRNSKITPEEAVELKAKYADIFQLCGGYTTFMHQPDTRNTFDVPPKERQAIWEALYEKPGFGKWMGVFHDIAKDEKANAEYSKFMADKIRSRVNDPVIAEKLIPKDHGFGSKRVPLETNYFEVYNQPHVRLCDVQETPIDQITEKGIKLSDGEDVELDVLVYATGFDAVTGAFSAIDFQGCDGQTLSEYWKDGPQTQLGIFVKGFPNMLMVMGPHQMYGNIPRCIEWTANWIGDCVSFCQDRDISRIEATEEGVEEWTEHVYKDGRALLSSKVDSWMTGVNKNLAHKQKRIIARYAGSAPEYRRLTKVVADNNYAGLRLN